MGSGGGARRQGGQPELELELDPELDEDPEPIPGHFPPGMAPVFGAAVPVLGVEPGVLVDPVLPVAAELDVPVDAEPVAAVLVAAVLGVLAGDESAANATDVPTPARAPVRTTPASNCFVRSLMIDYLVFSCGPWGTSQSCGCESRTGCETVQTPIRKSGRLRDDR
jgi:hypothetical protein